jgi:DNA-binding NarL/FixJ family response regulator
MISVAIVEDDRATREGLVFLINGTQGFTCANAYGDCETAIPDIVEDPPHVVIMDLGLPGMSGIEGIRRLKEKLPDLDVVVFTIHGEEGLVFDALCAGACGYLLKDTPPANLLNAIKEIKEGGAPMSAKIARMVVNSFKTQPNSSLTKREMEVLTELCKGKSYKMIAKDLFISEETVRRHIHSIYQKLHVSSKSEAVAKAFKEKLVLP